jgi:alpha-L-rhamnosidase
MLFLLILSKLLTFSRMKAISLFSVLLSVTLLFSGCNPVESPALVIGLKCEYQINPMGIDRSQPIFQWKMVDSRRGAGQSAYQLIVAKTFQEANHIETSMWDSGKIDSGQSVQVKYQGKPLESGKTYYWRVKIWDQDGKVTAWSEVASFEMGLLNQSDWKAQWIARDTAQPGRSAMMRKEVEISGKKIERARAYVTGLGNYVFFINGNRVGDALLTPGWTHYPDRLEYQVYDVKDFLVTGKNVLGSILGNMWWSGGLGWDGKQKYSNGPLKFLLQLEVDYSNGDRQTFITDNSWKWDNSPISADHIYDGEKYDANLEQPGWDKTGFDDSSWKPVIPAAYEGKLRGPFAPALKKQMELNPVNLTEPQPGEYVFDLGQNMVGWANFKFKADKGDTLKLRFAELLHADGTVAQENLRTAKAMDLIVSDGNEMVWEPKFTYHGFQYVQVSGLKYRPQQNDLVGMVIHADEPFVGKLECSNDVINGIYKNVTWSQRGNFFAVPTDCPQRDERLGWMGDAQIFAPTANFNMNLARYWAKWMFDITDGQEKEGWVYDVNPPIVVTGPSKPGWGDAIAVIPWLSYLYYGDKRVLEDNYDGIKAWVEYMNSKSEDYIYTWKMESSGDWNGYGDWIAYVPSPSKPIGTAYFYYSSKLLSKMARVLGNEADAEKYEMLSVNIAKAYQEVYWDPKKMNYEGATQTANLLPLAFGITPDSLKPRVAENIRLDVEAHVGHPTTGFLGTGYILPMLSKYGLHPLAYQMITKTDYPSWGYMVKQGATSIWELWNSDKERPEGMNSRNHFALGCVGEWMWNNVAGLNLIEEYPGFQRFLVRPLPVSDLSWAKAEYETNYGKIIIDWQIIDKVFTLKLTVPANSEAIVDLPGLKAGSKIYEGNSLVGVDDTEGITVATNGKISAKAGTYLFSVK